MVKQLSSFTAGDTGSTPGWETKTLQAMWKSQKTKKQKTKKKKTKEIQI